MKNINQIGKDKHQCSYIQYYKQTLGSNNFLSIIKTLQM